MLTLYTSSSWAFSIDDVAKQAQSLAGKGYETPKSNLPSVFRDMKYADYQQIQFNHDKAYWNNLKTPFKLEFYHQGMYFDTPVTAQTSIGDNGEIVESTVRYNPVTKGWRLVMRVKVKDAKKTTEMRAALVNADQTLSETWSYQLPANE